MTTLDPRAQTIPLGAAIAEAEKSGFLSIEELQRLALSQPQAGVPAAWRYRYNGRWYVCDSEEFARKGLDAHPLYASPPPSGAVVSVDAVAKMIAAWQQECAAFPDIYNQGHVLADRLAALSVTPPPAALSDGDLVKWLEDCGANVAWADDPEHHLIIEITPSDIRSALSVAPATADGWRELSSAPKDGTVVEVRSAIKANPAVFLAGYVRPKGLVAKLWCPVKGQSVGGLPWKDSEIDAWRPAAPTVTGGR